MSPLNFIGVLLMGVSVYAQLQVPVTVYYESLCPDSMKFITTQLFPTYNSALGKLMNVTLIPYGKATYEKQNDTYGFTCHHGEMECTGNKVQACILNMVTDDKTRMELINCLMTIANKSQTEYPTNECMKMVGVSTALAGEIITCANTTQGSELLAKLGNMTDSFQKPLTSVPTVAVNKVAVPMAVTDLRAVLCNNVIGAKPTECSKKNGATTISSAIVLVLISTFIVNKL